MTRAHVNASSPPLASGMIVCTVPLPTVAVPTAQSFLRSGVDDLPFDLAHVAAFVYVASLAVGIGGREIPPAVIHQLQ